MEEKERKNESGNILAGQGMKVAGWREAMICSVKKGAKGCLPAGAGRERVGCIFDEPVVLRLLLCRQMLAKKRNIVLRHSPGCKPGAGCLRGAKPRIFVYPLRFAAGEIRHIGYIKK